MEGLGWKEANERHMIENTAALKELKTSPVLSKLRYSFLLERTASTLQRSRSSRAAEGYALAPLDNW